MPVTTNSSAPLMGDYRDWSKGGRYGPTGENAPVQTGREGGRNQFDYWETNPDKVNAYLQANADDPKLRAAAERGDAALDAELHTRGIRVPEHYKAGVGPDGQVTVQEMSWWDKQKNWAMPAAMMGGAIAAPYAVGALAGGGGGAGAAGATGAGIGETGAVTGLAGSGFGGASVGGYSALAKIATNPKLIGMAAKGLGAYANSKANDRGTTLDAMMDRDRTQIYANQDQRAAERDATKQLAIAKYTGSGGYQPGTGGDPRYSSGIMAPTGSSSAQIQAAKDMERILLERINNPYKLTDVDKYAKAGKMERIAGYGSAALSGYEALKGFL